MKDKKFQVFVSSTYNDLKEERQAAVEAILSSGNIPAGMELFSAGDESQMTVIKRWINESDIYLLILGGRYGSIESKSGKSYTHLEYEYAQEINKPLFAVVITGKGLEQKFEKIKIEALEQVNTHLLNSFKELVTKNLVRFWDDKKDIKIAIHETLAEFAYSKPLIGWVRGDNSVNANLLAEEIARVTKENSELRQKLQNAELNQTTHYAGLTFNEMQDILRRESIAEEASSNLYEYVANNGRLLATGVVSSVVEQEIIDKLLGFKLISHIGYSNDLPVYRFSDVGHNFYLKTLTKI